MSQKLLNCIRTLSPTLLARRHPVFVTQKANKLIIYEHHRKGEYDTEVETTTKEKLKKGYEIIKQGIPEFKDEVKEFLEADLFFCASHGDYEYFAKFNGTKSLNNWVVTTDSDFRHGRSKAAFDITANNKAVFHGHLDPWVPKDGRQKKSGYINLRSPFNYVSICSLTLLSHYFWVAVFIRNFFWSVVYRLFFSGTEIGPSESKFFCLRIVLF